MHEECHGWIPRRSVLCPYHIRLGQPRIMKNIFLTKGSNEQEKVTVDASKIPNVFERIYFDWIEPCENNNIDIARTPFILSQTREMSRNFLLSTSFLHQILE